MTKRQKCYEFKKMMSGFLEVMEDEIMAMPDKGGICEESQKICLLNALHELWRNVNGTKPNDFANDDDL